MWLVAIVIVIAFGGGHHFPGFCLSACSRSNMKPKANPKQARKCIEELFCWFQVLRQQFILRSFACMFLNVSFICVHIPFILHSFCIHFPSFSFHSPFMFLSFVINFLHFPFIYSFRIHSNVHSCPFIFLSSSFQFACMFLSFCIHILWFPF